MYAVQEFTHIFKIVVSLKLKLLKKSSEKKAEGLISHYSCSWVKKYKLQYLHTGSRSRSFCCNWLVFLRFPIPQLSGPMTFLFIIGFEKFQHFF